MLRVHESVFLRTASTVPVVVVFGIVGIEYFVYVTEHLVPAFRAGHHPFWHGLEALAFHAWTLLLIVSYVCVVFTDPGYVTEHVIERIQDALHDALEDATPPDSSSPTASTASSTALPQCHRCKQLKPMRAHHCSFCGRCVLKMDHHCPWVANCIGEGNYKYFLLFVWYAFLALLMVSTSLFGKFHAAVFKENVDTGLSLLSLVCIVLACSLTFSLGAFVVVHSTLVLYGASTIECHIYGRKSPYNLGWRQNCREVFGDAPVWQWFLPIPPVRGRHAMAVSVHREYAQLRAKHVLGEDDGESPAEEEEDRFL